MGNLASFTSLTNIVFLFSKENRNLNARQKRVCNGDDNIKCYLMLSATAK